ncbi:helix-hairpin-helix domain-containing protein [Burkholderia contaminans]|uniref:Helix-hairpin-helix domain-containing protein n=1 Tax=Burkholderia contaminans TaxID=488447 RepID=A0A3N8NC97_9BURK|nr:helix-hairpin-helix domain-containing protein [Burkholderia contaminans]MCA8152282.1 helix-hairpin-helix domain-containing protein [Burkholderia contaminans]RQS92145.1 helix-hairpin-helix domain-containing protein [Burkholderia contaminans]RQT04496.1 helix-hairpin-helix domain-containing protein [Burkholderia contaminans]RQT17742.1 helix-hairpin-helix domain-containing protein [Burkholderia contaminans]RQT25127.1 helix-hairpin-helix domain-containing protein [Burkholderia contaminans]
MLKKLLMLFVALSLSLAAGLAAAVEVNSADQAALESVKGLGPVKSKAIIDERTKNGPFKDADDLANRVKGLGTKSVGHLEENGLTIGGSSTPPKGVKLSKPAATTSATTSAGTASTSTTATTGTTAAAPAPAASAPDTAAKPAKAKRTTKKEKAAAAAAASADAGASAPAAASSAKATKGSKKKSKKDKAASAAAASGA